MSISGQGKIDRSTERTTDPSSTYSKYMGGHSDIVAVGSVGMSEEETAVGMPVNVIRLHVGLENIDTLIADVEQAFEASKRK